MNTATGLPTTYLFVPGNRPERFAKALASGADRVILDLEDAVAPPGKADARTHIATWLAALPEADAKRVVVRINDAHSPCHADDLNWLRAQAVQAVMLAKCESAAQVAAVLACLPDNGHVLALIETAGGVLAAPDIARAPGVSRLAFGSLDYALDMDLPGPGLALDSAALALALASRAANLPPPVAGVTPELDAEQVRTDLTHARSLGYGAKMCIHPLQVATVAAAMQPDAATLLWAQRVVDSWAQTPHTGVIQMDGHMVDKPVLLKAQRILALAGTHH